MYYSESATISKQIIEEALRYIAGGVVSLNRKVDPHIVFQKGVGSKIYDVDGNEYIDYHAAFAPHLLGHNNDVVNAAVIQTIEQSWSLFGSGTNELEVRLAKLLCESVASLERVQITNTGSEATAHAIRLSRAYTGREDIVLTLGGYNGWHNDVSRVVLPSLQQIGKRIIKGEYGFLPSSAGIPEALMSKVHVINFNDLDSLAFVLDTYPIACVLTEPVLQNVGVVLPKPEYLSGVIDLCKKHGALSVFDEVKTGFRSGLGGYQSVAGVTPDLSVFGKAVANGYPMGVIGGRREIMDLLDEPDPARRVLFAGTYNAHPINTAAAIATIGLLQDKAVYDHISSVSNALYDGLESLFDERGLTAIVARNASAFCVYFMEHEPQDMHDILNGHNFELDVRYRKALIRAGVYHIPTPAKQGSVSWAHTNEDVARTLDVTRRILKEL
jgi:glutamate-1-semialdehyde 2,1-aminomutase